MRAFTVPNWVYVMRTFQTEEYLKTIALVKQFTALLKKRADLKELFAKIT